jgi:hypothetical protein
MSKFDTSMLQNDPIEKIECGSCFFIIQTQSNSYYGSIFEFKLFKFIGAGTNNFFQLGSEDTHDQNLVKIMLPFSPTSFSCGNYYSVFYSTCINLIQCLHYADDFEVWETGAIRLHNDNLEGSPLRRIPGQYNVREIICKEHNAILITSKCFEWLP